MATRNEHPNLLNSFATASPRYVRGWAIVAVLFWLALLTGDWFVRLVEFRWQDKWLPLPVATGQPARTAESFVVPAETGGGLTKMVPVPRVAARYAEFHAEKIAYRDERGYFNEASPSSGYYPILMLGDSFLVSQETQTVAQALSNVSGHPVYNHGSAAAGPFLEMRRYLAADHLDPKPAIVVWDLAARELGAGLFQRQPIASWFRQTSHNKEIGAPAKPSIQWNNLMPDRVRRDWPNTSILAFFGRQLWGQIKLLAFQEWPWDVVGRDDPVFGPMLFYRENLRVLPLLTPGENAQAIVGVVQRIADEFRSRGQTLTVLLIPEKEQIHLRALSREDQQGLAGGDQLLAEIEMGLQAQGIPVVNLMPVFRDATEQGQRLYWRDDTHWNDAGIRLAAEEIWRVIEPLLKTSEKMDGR